MVLILTIITPTDVAMEMFNNLGPNVQAIDTGSQGKLLTK